MVRGALLLVQPGKNSSAPASSQALHRSDDRPQPGTVMFSIVAENIHHLARNLKLAWNGNWHSQPGFHNGASRDIDALPAG